MQKKFKPSLSKSQLMRGLNCPKSLWLFRHEKHLATPPDEWQQEMFDQGHEVGKLAQKKFPEGKVIHYNLKPFNRKFELTRHYITAKVPAIFEATFQVNGLMCMIDILRLTPDGWELIEVKSSTSVKEEHLTDLSIQFYILKQTGLPVSGCKLMHINPNYVRIGELDINQFFITVDLTNQIKEKRAEIKDIHKTLDKTIDGSKPEISIGAQCNTPYECDFKAHCWSTLPKYSIFNVPGIDYLERFDLHKSGITDPQKIPPDFPLTLAQTTQIEAHKTGNTIIKKEELQNFLSPIKYPIYYLDFETFYHAIPRFTDSKPYEQIPFQYSIHKQESPDAELIHYEFLAEPGTDPRPNLVVSLISHIPPKGTVMVYNQKFEQEIIADLAELYPDYKSALLAINKNMQDLMIPFKDRLYYDPQMNGSFSLKTVLPLLVPELNYDTLDISNGATASLTYSHFKQIPPDQVESTKTALLEYCKLDTYALYELYKTLQKLSNSKRPILPAEAKVQSIPKQKAKKNKPEQIALF